MTWPRPRARPSVRLTLSLRRASSPFAGPVSNAHHGGLSHLGVRSTPLLPFAPMSRPLGALCIVLHGHLPYVLHHGSYPHGEAWLYEAAAETYLPILDMVGECALLKARPAITLGLTPVLLEQLGHERFKTGFVDYLNERRERAIDDRKMFEKEGNGHSAYLATR